MFGLFFAALCGIGLAKLWRPRRFRGGPFRGRGPARLDRLMRKINATPEQESAIRQSVDEVRQAFRTFNPKARLGMLSAALTAETVQRDQLLRQIREPETGSISEALVNAVERLRDSLGTGQRQKLAAMMTGNASRCH